MSWEESLLEYQTYLKLEKHMANNTIESYMRDIKKLQQFSPLLPQEHTYDSLVEFVHAMAKEYSQRSQARILSGLKSYFNYLQYEEIRQDNPTELLESPKIGTKLPDVLTEKEIDRLVDVIDLSKPEGERNRAIIEMLYGCGLRVTELVNLRISDLFFEEGYIRVLGKGNKERLVPISPYTIKYIDLYRNEIRKHQPIQPGYEDILFLNRRGRNITRVMIFTIIKELSIIAGIQKNISPHTFRHSFATHLLKNGADLRAIQQMLGHENIVTTEVYTHIDQEHLREAIFNHHPRNK
ncbi:site-specific tyrosine recombinase XerD [uncultured Weeksella sp.]|uniref:site-specific tyrosine recombinase XerD n=1 Tax=uncultured Weeksella sp. TaxID=1161389 RepID=UPI00259B61CC|nr:site-specific tyrosine recombinase XerD [uncultured Weeksella sp.]